MILNSMVRKVLDTKGGIRTKTEVGRECTIRAAREELFRQWP